MTASTHIHASTTRTGSITPRLPRWIGAAVAVAAVVTLIGGAQLRSDQGRAPSAAATASVAATAPILSAEELAFINGPAAAVSSTVGSSTGSLLSAEELAFINRSAPSSRAAWGCTSPGPC